MARAAASQLRTGVTGRRRAGARRATVRTAAGSAARLVRYDGPERFDVLPLLIGTDGAFTALGVDHRRLRPNIVIGGVDGLAERDWPGRRLRIGGVIVSAVKLRARCVMTTYDPDTQTQDLSVLRRKSKSGTPESGSTRSFSGRSSSRSGKERVPG